MLPWFSVEDPSASIITCKIDNWRSMVVQFRVRWEVGKRSYRITIPLSKKSVCERLHEGRQNCRGAINDEELRRRKKRCLSEIEILAPRRLKQQLKARYSRPSIINYSRNRPGVSRGSGSSEDRTSNSTSIKYSIDGNGNRIVDFNVIRRVIGKIWSRIFFTTNSEDIRTRLKSLNQIVRLGRIFSNLRLGRIENN